MGKSERLLAIALHASLVAAVVGTPSRCLPPSGISGRVGRGWHGAGYHSLGVAHSFVQKMVQRTGLEPDEHFPWSAYSAGIAEARILHRAWEVVGLIPALGTYLACRVDQVFGMRAPFGRGRGLVVHRAR